MDTPLEIAPDGSIISFAGAELACARAAGLAADPPGPHLVFDVLDCSPSLATGAQGTLTVKDGTGTCTDPGAGLWMLANRKQLGLTADGRTVTRLWFRTSRPGRFDKSSGMIWT